MGLRLIATLIGSGFLLCAAVAVFRGTLYDVDDGRVDRAARPIIFWLLVFGMTVLGLSILAVGWQWPIVGIMGRVIGRADERSTRRAAYAWEGSTQP